MTTNVITAIVTAYCACRTCCGPSASNLTAGGKPPTCERTIAASRSIPFGSRVVVAGRIYTVEDRLAKRFDSRFDIFMSSHQAALNFGIKTQSVVVITK